MNEYERDIDYGTHTLPKKFWVTGKGSIRSDPSYQERRAAKKIRHEQNKADKAEKNRSKK